MGRKPNALEGEPFADYLRSGRDEMNLLEHSISGADKKPDMNTRSLHFEASERHPETGEPVVRSWKVTFSAEFGRPTPKDDDVFVALLKVSQAAGLMDADRAAATDRPQVQFSSYQLIRILGWPENGPSYKAIDDALNRIGGVWIVAKNFWYDNVEKEYVSRKFGIIDDVFLYERDLYDRALKKARAEGRDRPLSWIRWSEVMADSFRAGYVRKLDIEFYRSLEHPIARKLYRYLGKQFWNRTKHRIDLQTLCHEKLGYHTGERRHARLREKIAPALAELEAKGAYGLSHEFDSGYGRCEVLFTAKRKADAKPAAPRCNITEQLTSLGISAVDAALAVAKHSSERIAEDLEHLEFAAKAGRIKTSKPGLLAQMLRSDEPWKRPEGFVSTAVKRRKAEEAARLLDSERARQAQLEAAAQSAAAMERADFEAFLGELTARKELEAFRDEALQQERFIRKQYQEAKQQGNAQRMAMYLDLALETHWKKAYRRQASVQKSIRF